MSQENVEVVRRWLAALSVSPEEARAAIPKCWDADPDYYPVRKFPEAQPCHGREEVAQFVAQYLDAYSRSEWAIQEVIQVGTDRVLVCANLRAEGRGSGVKLEGDLYQCFWLRHSRFFRVEDHLTLSGALHALGLEGETLEAAGLEGQAVSQENVELLRAQTEEVWVGTSKFDPEATISKLAELWDPEIELDASEAPVLDLSEVHRGTDAVRQFWREWFAAWENLRFEYELVGAGDRVVMLLDLRMRGRSTGIEVPFGKFAWLITFRDGLMVHQKLYMSQSAALEAVGLQQ